MDRSQFTKTLDICFSFKFNGSNPNHKEFYCQVCLHTQGFVLATGASIAEVQT